jgi:uncharacterized protein YdeI (YjbR/CyaY-like superfamily)
VKGTIDGVPYQSTLLPSGDGRRFFVVKKQIRDAIGKSAGDEVKILMEADQTPRAIEAPNDFQRALSANKSKEFFTSLSPSRKKQYTDWIVDSKKPETRKTRIEKAIKRLSERKKLK